MEPRTEPGYEPLLPAEAPPVRCEHPARQGTTAAGRGRRAGNYSLPLLPCSAAGPPSMEQHQQRTLWAAGMHLAKLMMGIGAPRMPWGEVSRHGRQLAKKPSSCWHEDHRGTFSDAESSCRFHRRHPGGATRVWPAGSGHSHHLADLHSWPHRPFHAQPHQGNHPHGTAQLQVCQWQPVSSC